MKINTINHNYIINKTVKKNLVIVYVGDRNIKKMYKQKTLLNIKY